MNQPVHGPDDRRRDARPSPWEWIWSRMTAVERRAAATAYLAASASVPLARDSVNAVLARELRTRPATIARWSLDRQADRLARLPRWDPLFLALVIAAFHVECRRRMVTTFLDAARIPHDHGVLGREAFAASSPRAVLSFAIETARADFGARDLDLYLDALEAQRVPCLAELPAARGRPDSPNPVAETRR